MGEEILFDTLLIEEMGNKKSTIVILGFFLKDSHKDISDLEKVLAENDMPGIFNKAHKLKGSLAMLHAHKLVDILEQLEFASGKEKDIERSRTLINSFTQVYAVLISQLEKEVASIKASLA
jgi:HPt (histidine-containing phosphotransfer) domain-containing protein